jgi:hypothetical protein
MEYTNLSKTFLKSKVCVKIPFLGYLLFGWVGVDLYYQSQQNNQS